MRFSRLITTVDAHAGGEPLRIVTGGLPPLPGATMLDRRRAMAERHDDVRRALLWEPRGHADMYGAVLTPAVSAEADFGVLFLTNEGYSTMCGHGVIALTTALIETGVVAAMHEDVVAAYDTPAGLVRARACLDRDRVTAVAFRNVPSFRYATGVEVPTSAGKVRADVAFGGAFYALVDAADLGVPVERQRVADLIRLGMEVKRGVDAVLDVTHPQEPELRGIYGTIISEAARRHGGDGRNVTVYAEGAVDRSPCGTGTSAKLANLHAAGRIAVNQPYVHESVTDSVFTGRVVGETTVGPYPGVETEIAGRGFVTGFHQFVIDPDDPAREGFLVR